MGFLMSKVTGHKDIHVLYGPKSRVRDFANADWRFLLRASLNTARAFAVVHDSGCVIGDVNHGSVLVSEKATVRLVDCDSFQIVVGDRRFPCEVGVQEFTPPELQNAAFVGTIRTTNHDNFALAILIFRLLFMGKHPFAGRYLGKGDMPPERAIAEFRFVYGARQPLIQMERPPGAPSLSLVGNVVGSLFEQAFAREMVAGGRPTGRQWADALADLEKEVIPCRTNKAHWYPRSNPACPWCAMEAVTGAALFGYVIHDPVLGARIQPQLFLAAGIVGAQSRPRAGLASTGGGGFARR